MTGSTNNQFGDTSREPVPTTRKEQVTDAMTYWSRRGDFPDGEATVLVVDFFQDLWSSYEEFVPAECNLLLARDTQTGEQMVRDNPRLGVVIVQGLARRKHNREVDQMLKNYGVVGLGAYLNYMESAGNMIEDWLDSFDHTLAFVEFLRKQKFTGLVQVVSKSLKSYQIRQLQKMEGMRVQCMDKDDLFEGGFTNKSVERWQSIGRYEAMLTKLSRPPSPQSGVWRTIDNLLAQAIEPLPTAVRLFERWSEEDRRNRYFDGRAMPETPIMQALEYALTWLEDLENKIATGTPREIFDFVSQLPESRQHCDCISHSDSGYTHPEDRWLRSFHFHLHHDFNQAVWEIVDEAGLMEWMRLELELDLASRNTELVGFGRWLRRSYGRQLRRFFRPQMPSEMWIGWRAKVRY